jgi:hypothetical protein
MLSVSQRSGFQPVPPQALTTVDIYRRSVARELMYLKEIQTTCMRQECYGKLRSR